MTTNDEPSSTEILRIRNCIEESHRVLSPLRAQRAQAEAILNSLTKRIEEEERLLSQYHCALAPIRWIPLEILTEIFLFTRDWQHKYPDDYHPVGPRPGRGCLWISHVCSSWRRLSLSTPKLWNTIRVEPRSSYSLTEEFRLLTWLERTGPCTPLDIIFHCMSSRWKYRHVAVSLAWMRPYVSRIRHLSLEGSLCELPVGVFDILETLEFTDVDLKETDFPDNGFGATPLLRRLVFTQAFVQLPFLSLLKLTDLRLNTGEEDPISESVLLRFLSRCNALVTLYVSCIVKDDIDAYGEGEDAIPFDRWEDGKISMLHLTSLTVVLFDKTFWLLSYLVLPVLSCLAIDSATDWSQTIYRSFLYQSSPPLRTLVLQGSLMREDAFLDLLRHTPSLVHVTVTNSIHVTSTLIEGMAWGDDDATLGIGPWLETMHIEDSHMYIAADTEWLCNGAITEMISSRDSSGNSAVLVKNSQTESARVTVHRSHRPKNPLWTTQCKEIKQLRKGVGVHIFF